MDYAFSLVKLETLSVEDFLQLDGDEGWLIGKNLIVCAECRANVFLRRGEKRAPHFAHTKFKDTNDGCSKRVGKYTPEKVKSMRVKQSKYRVGYFQQRFEDYMYMALVETLKQSNLFFVRWATDQDNKPFIDLQKVNDENFNEYITMLRDFGDIISQGMRIKNDNKGIKSLVEASQYWIDLNREVITKGGSEEHRKVLKEALKYEGGINKNYVVSESIEQLKELKYSFSDRDNTFAVESITHLLTKGAEPLVASATSGAMQLFLSTELTRVWRQHAKVGVFEEEQYAMSTEFLLSYLDDGNQATEATFTSARLLRSWLQLYDDSNFEEVINKITSMEKDLMLFGAKYRKDWGKNSKKGATRPFFVETYSFITRLFKFINFADTAKSFYGDDSSSPEEMRRKAIDANRGFIYIAWAPYLKGIWEPDLKRKGFKDCVKIGYSDDPDRRKTEIAGNIGPADSVSIEDVWPIFDMQQAEKFIHRKLNRYRLSQNREIFGLAVEEAQSKVDELIKEFSKPKSKSSNKGF